MRCATIDNCIRNNPTIGNIVKTILFVIAFTLFISACSSKPTKDVASENDAQQTQPSVVYNTEEPTSYAEYRRWRKNNDPASEAYADYKAWEINYRKWKEEQKTN